MRPGSGFYRPLGSHFIWLHGGALDDAWRLAGGFFHELAHVGQEFGTPRILRWIPQGLQRLSQWLAKPGEKNIFRKILYSMNPIEGHAFASGLAYIENVEMLFSHLVFTRPILSLLNKIEGLCR